MHVEPENKGQLNWGKTILLAMPIAMLLAAGMLFYLKGMRAKTYSVAGLPAHGSAPAFKLTNQNGDPVSESMNAGKIWLADFIFTRCGSACPEMSAAFRSLQKEYPDLHLVSFSVDPLYDTPERLKKYAERYEAAPGRWSFLTGEENEMKKTAEGFHVTGPEEPMFHSNKFILVDGDNTIRGYFDYSDSGEMNKLRQILNAI